MRALLAVFLLFLTLVPAVAQEATPAAPSADKIKELSALLADPGVQTWLQESAAAAATSSQSPGPGSAGAESGALSAVFLGLQAHLHGLAAAMPHLPAEFAQARQRLIVDVAGVGLLGTLLLIAGFVALGLGTEWIFWRSTKGVRQKIAAAPVDSVGNRLKIMAFRFLFGLCWIAAFAIGSLGACLLFPWPPFLRTLLLGVLTVTVAARFALVLARFLLSPGNERLRIVPTTTEAAWYWTYRLTVFAGYAVFAWVALDLMSMLGFAGSSLRLIGYPFGLVALLILAEAIWNQPARVPEGTPPSVGHRIALIVYLTIAWLVGRVLGLQPIYSIMLVALLLPLAIRISHRAVLHLLRPLDQTKDSELPGEEAEAAPPVEPSEFPSTWTVVVERGLRLVFFAIGAAFIIQSLGFDVNMMTASDDLLARMLRSIVRAIAILLAADLIWQLAKVAIDRQLREAAREGEADPAEIIRRRQRIRTLLPIIRNILFIVLATMAILMALSTLGIEVGPLIAGAGVVGVAIGFGAQTLVKDVISGMFYLLDDAFRIGEYIVSGSYKGTVESFSLRSVKLRHHRGPLYTVPFGELGAIQNMSRDWVIDKLAINVTYDTDLDKAKKIIKQIGKDLLADPELGPGFIEPLKMQGVDSFGDFAMQIRLKMMTYPGKQFPIRRRAYAMIRRAFAENGIEIAVPTVRVAGGEQNDASEVVAAKAATDALAAKAVNA